MNKRLTAFISVITLLCFVSWSKSKNNIIAGGKQPQIAVDTKGIVRIAFGRKDKIFCVKSSDQGLTFSKPVLVAEIPDMHLGMSRGPQLASSLNYSIITAIDKSGNIHWYRSDHLSNEWRSMGIINDLKGSGPEGLMGIAADKKDNFYAVWLDIRTGKQNEIYFSSVSGKETRWSKNIMVYRSPDGHVCECCKPSVAAEGSHVAIMFRNWLNGSRDLYLLQSENKGKSFGVAEKLGQGTWKLNACPMDGGGLFIDSSKKVHTTWQREGYVYYSMPGETETNLGKGRICSISGANSNTIISMQNSDTVKLTEPSKKRVVIIGPGSFLKSVVMPDKKIFCTWEQENKIMFKEIGVNPS